MFLLHPDVAQVLNQRSLQPPFGAGAMAGSNEQILQTFQGNRTTTTGSQALPSSGGTGGSSGGAAGPGSGPAGAGTGSDAGSSPPPGGSNGAAGGVPVGGQETGRWVNPDSKPYVEDDVNATVIASGLSSGTGVGSSYMIHPALSANTGSPVSNDDAKLGGKPNTCPT